MGSLALGADVRVQHKLGTVPRTSSGESPFKLLVARNVMESTLCFATT